jgi:hypothetical protein
MSQAVSANAPRNHLPESKNPLLDGILLASNELEMFPLIAKNPFLDKIWLSRNQDIDLFRAYLSSVVVPTSSMLKICLDIHRAFKTSVYQLNPLIQQNRIAYFSPSHSTSTSVVTQTTHSGVVILGLTGLGKTFQLVAALSTIPQTIERAGLPGMSSVTQITWIRIDMSSIASIEALAEQIIQAIDDALNANGKVYDDILAGVRSASTKMERAMRLLRTHYVSILAVDEIQANNFSRPDSANLRFWFLRIANQKISLIFSGNPLGFELHPPKKETDDIRYATQQLRRLFASNRTRLDPAESIYEPDWKNLRSALATCHLDGSRDSFDEELENHKLQLTGGFPDFYVALHSELERIRMARPGCKIDKEMINQAAKASSLIQVMQPLISAFTMRDPIALRKCTDVDHDYYLQKWRQAAKSAPNVGSKHTATPPAPSADAPEPDPTKLIEDDRKKLEKMRNKQRAKANAPASPIKNDVLGYHLDQLNTLITGSSPTDDVE